MRITSCVRTPNHIRGSHDPWYLTLDHLLCLHLTGDWSVGRYATGVRRSTARSSRLAQPQMTFAGEELYPSLAEKAAALGFSLVCNHPFVDGNK